VREHLKQVVLDWCEYSGISHPEAVNLINKGSELACDEWRCMVKNYSDDEILSFYTYSKYYIYEVLQPYLEPEKYNKDINYLKILRFAENILKKRGLCRVLDFGAGVGELCLLLAEVGCKVTYCDLLGEISKFAIWRFKKYNTKIEIIWSRVNGVELPSQTYDLIVSDAVLEHLKREYAGYFIRAIFNALVDDGYLYLLWDPTYSQDFPYHILGLKAKEMDKFLKSYNY
jgi:SAM-dependent methyltransferase